jgi:hypothetical protein
VGGCGCDLFGRHMEFKGSQRHAEKRGEHGGKVRGHSAYREQIKEKTNGECGA